MQPLPPWKTAPALAHPIHKQKIAQSKCLQTAPQQQGAEPGNSVWLYLLVTSSLSSIKREKPSLQLKREEVWCRPSSPDAGQEFSKVSLCSLSLWGSSSNVCCDHWWIQEYIFLFGAGHSRMIRKCTNNCLETWPPSMEAMSPFQICSIVIWKHWCICRWSRASWCNI